MSDQVHDHGGILTAIHGLKPPPLRNVSVGKLHPSPYNPPWRTDPKNPALRRLIKIIKEMGLWYPILIDPKNRILEGHRRHRSIIELSHGTIPAYTIEYGSPERLYALLNDGIARQSQHDKLGIWLHEPLAVPQRVSHRLFMIQDVIGKPLLRRLYNAHMGTNAFKLAMDVATATGDDDNATIQGIVEWLIDHRMVGLARQTLSDYENGASLILRAVRKGRPLVTSVGLG